VVRRAVAFRGRYTTAAPRPPLPDAPPRAAPAHRDDGLTLPLGAAGVDRIAALLCHAERHGKRLEARDHGFLDRIGRQAELYRAGLTLRLWEARRLEEIAARLGFAGGGG
jgi:hypothetical protein